MHRLALALPVFLSLSACHLADTAEPPTCPAGAHVDNGHCVGDISGGTTITITSSSDGGASSCAPMPASITVVPNGDFHFKNDDTVDHVIAGADGQPWATAKAGQVSPTIGITKVGSWPYTISDCGTPGVVVVQ